MLLGQETTIHMCSRVELGAIPYTTQKDCCELNIPFVSLLRHSSLWDYS